MVRDTRARGVVRSLAALAALGLAAPLAGCYTQITTVRPESDFTSATTGDSEEYFPSERSQNYHSRYPEDLLFDPYLTGLSYTTGSAYDRYYSTPYWYNVPWHTGGASAGSASDTTRAQRPGRDLWLSPPPVPPPATSIGAPGTGSGSPQGAVGQGGTPADSSGATQPQKKQPKRRVWK